MRAAYPLIRRTAAFLAICLILTGTIGPRIISHGLVGKDGFQIYGGAGKSLLFGLVVLAVLVGRRKQTIKLTKWMPCQITWIVLTILAAIISWIGISQLIAGTQGILWPVVVNISMLSSVVFAALGTIGVVILRKILNTYKKELLISLGLSVIFYGFLYAVYNLWQILATSVLYSVKWLLTITGIHASILAPRTLLLSKFGINVAQYCSGIESIALFSGLYAVIGVLDWGKFNKGKLLWAFPIALILLFGFNILRVYSLILAGYYINPQIAFSLFHTYAGMIFFIIFSGIFWLISYRWMIIDKSIKTI